MIDGGRCATQETGYIVQSRRRALEMEVDWKFPLALENAPLMLGCGDDSDKRVTDVNTHGGSY